MTGKLCGAYLVTANGHMTCGKPADGHWDHAASTEVRLAPRSGFFVWAPVEPRAWHGPPYNLPDGTLYADGVISQEPR